MFFPNANPEKILSVVKGIKTNEGDVFALMIGEKNRPDVSQLISGLREEKIDFFGGIFPGIIWGDQKYDEGAILIRFPALHKPFLIRGLDQEHFKIPEFREKIGNVSENKYTAMIFVDGLTSHVSCFLSEVFNRLGNSVTYIGGGAGSLTLKQTPCLFTPEGFIQDGAIVTFIRLGCQLGVRHGWRKIMGPLISTKTEKNVIAELNWKNAFDVYKETVERDSGRQLESENFFDVAKGYPFGIYKEGMEDVVRDPIAVNQKKELVCVGEVPENAALSILKGEETALIRAAGQAAEDCMSGGIQNVRQVFVADCVSRAIFLEDNFTLELKTIHDKVRLQGNPQSLAGVLTLGEISSYGEGFIELFNKTTVVGAIREL